MSTMNCSINIHNIIKYQNTKDKGWK